ncbi:hypothetical protein RJT34_31292 [Clitoria ternatea]|uniref:Uncharacterized protein n=1 Tax=Clitoria ternatea TaxID=43366 RepID=A0AAN9EV20_CLITE
MSFSQGIENSRIEFLISKQKPQSSSDELVLLVAESVLARNDIVDKGVAEGVVVVAAEVVTEAFPAAKPIV